MDTEKKRSGGAKSYAVLLGLVLLGVGAVAAFGFYQEEVSAFVRLEGWNLGSAAAATRSFVEAASANDGERVAPMLADEKSPDLEGVRENGKLVALIIPDYGGPVTRRLKEIAPSTDAQYSTPELVTQNGGSVIVEVTYPAAHRMQLRWDRLNGAWKLKAIGWTAKAP